MRLVGGGLRVGDVGVGVVEGVELEDEDEVVDTGTVGMETGIGGRERRGVGRGMGMGGASVWEVEDR